MIHIDAPPGFGVKVGFVLHSIGDRHATIRI